MNASNSQEPTYSELVSRESELWGRGKGERPLTWLESPLVYRYVNLQISGHPDIDYLDYIKRDYLGVPASLGLNVGCGHGELERLIIQRGLAKQMHGFDISSPAVECAREEAEKAQLSDRIAYFTADANYLDRSGVETNYDVIFISMALHHMAHLRQCLQNLYDRLKPGGLLVANEFIGPYRFQWTDAQLDIVNRLLRRLPGDLTRNLRVPTQNKRRIERPTLEYMIEHMAFESICSHEIADALAERFEIVERKNYGGAILHLLFEAIMGNFEEETRREHAVIIRLLCEFEGILSDYGVVEHDHALFVCRK